MQNGEFQVRRLADGAIDYSFYKAEAARLRAEAKRDWLSGWLARLSRKWTGVVSPKAPEAPQAWKMRTAFSNVRDA
jgi:hypothetical protein